MIYKKYLKRVLDIALSLWALGLCLPLIMVLSLLIWITSKSTPFFLQRRPGKDQRPFYIIKFKTMRPPLDKYGCPMAVKDRITPLGAFLRKFSLDEIPQFFNVLKGDMSIVGPRPLLCTYLSLYNDFQAKRHRAKPGITGWAQVNGRNSLSWTEKFEYDVYYVEHISFAFDMKILGLTVLKVIRKEGINQNNDMPMRAFEGNEVQKNQYHV